ncbi:uncharacterized protein SCHCODRAFT_02667437 [Schizophyllum commune H4-8]|uniref:uncharacterized protein n=1 Tax=Schizophyllum commune (strain H4-8 / FGSC 9210) TaxID=578458 RepID=UPI00215F2567|nr:uncharacterized protein SCHCODRAFT_02667437 [Schizophyllum commune H4-8]KAI5894434.1 hypothetical protein SCHCODRAFT_02667437 [Schizophyllum commune H4-8]
MVAFGPAYEELVVTRTDLVIATILGFGYFVALHCVREVVRARRVTTYLFLIWGELLACLIYGTTCWLYLYEVIPPSFGIFFTTTTVWAFQVQLLLQIICNRIGILMDTPRQRKCLKLAIAFLVLLINISVYVVWVPSKMGVGENFKKVNVWWDRVEVSCDHDVWFLTVCVALLAFCTNTQAHSIAFVQLTKYDTLVRYNTGIAIVSCAMDVFIICMMSLRNDFVYNQVHPVAYIVKLNIEIAMSDLIRKVASSTGLHIYGEASSTSGGTSGTRMRTDNITTSGFRSRTNPVEVHIGTEIMTTQDPGMPLEELDSKRGGTKRDLGVSSGSASDVWDGDDNDKQ